MTAREEQELKRLEVNTQRLLELVRKQSAQIKHLEEDLLKTQGQRDDLLKQLEEMHQDRSAQAIALDLEQRLQNSNLDTRAYLTEIIDEVKKSIAQLEQL